jgi:hypothetical protein
LCFLLLFLHDFPLSLDCSPVVGVDGQLEPLLETPFEVKQVARLQRSSFIRIPLFEVKVHLLVNDLLPLFLLQRSLLSTRR